MGTQDITLVNDQTQGWPADAVDDDAPLRRGSLVGRYLVPVFEAQLPADDDRWDEIRAWRARLDPEAHPP